ncbi:unnamed protein product [Pocillopora meandrina]|uniref:Uncharacterized protein n=1 Tax=Pocillopora meandrina TaxID=46732 RepID=A0AAU9VV22_9CNID|nr:unnamed protein product [Pocillopora meandrina]
MVKREFGMIPGGLSLKYRKYMAITSAALLTAKNVEVPLVNDKEIDKLTNYISTSKMNDKELKTEEAPASLLPGPAGASLQSGFIQVTSTDKNKMKPNKDPEHVAAGKKLAEHNGRVREEKEKKGGSKDPSPKVARLQPQPEPSSSFSLTQILLVASVILSLAGL